MTKVTREECEKVYANFEVIREILNKNDLLPCYFDKSMVSFATLIKDHFDNPPLKFEELEVDTWVWDAKYNEYGYIGFIGGKCPHICYIHGTVDDSKFEENRFFRKQVI